jgi:hypothetical protein
MSNTLLPCPFCGNMGSFWSTDQCQTLYATCIFCGARTVDCDTPEEVIAAWNSRADARQLALKTRVCPMCEDCPDGCPVETPNDSRNIVTNADRIRSLNDEELAEYIFGLGNGPENCDGHCAYQDDCNAEGFNYSTCIKACIKEVTDWLKQPVKEE